MSRKSGNNSNASQSNESSSDDFEADDKSIDIDHLMNQLKHYKPRSSKRNKSQSKSGTYSSLVVAITALTKQVKNMQVAVEKQSKKFDSVINRIEELESNNAEQDQKILDLNARMTSVESGPMPDDKVVAMERKIDDIEQIALNSKVILRTEQSISTATAGAGSSPSDTEVIRDYLTSQLQLSSVDTPLICARQIDSDGKKFILDLGNPDIRQKLFRKCKELKPPGLFLSEFLTKRLHKLTYDLRKLKDTHPNLKRVYSDHGRVYVMIEGVNGPRRVNSVGDATALL